MDLTRLDALCDSVRKFNETNASIDYVSVASTISDTADSVFATVQERNRTISLTIVYKTVYKDAMPPAEEVS